jgi:hypothetical protein
MTPERFMLLAEKYLEGSLSEEEARELRDAPGELRGRLLDEVAVAGLLARAEGKGPGDLSARVLAGLRASSEKRALVTRVMGGLPRRGTRWRVILGVGVAAACLIGLHALLRPVPPQVPASLQAEPASRPLAPEVRSAVEKALRYLHQAPLPVCSWNGSSPSDELVLWTFQSAGVSADDPMFGRLLGSMLEAGLQRTYGVSLQAMVLARLDAAKYRRRIADCGQFLVDNQCINGQWSYGSPTVPSAGGEIRRTRDGPLSGNNSCSQFAAMGLQACAGAGVRVPPEALDRAIRAWHECQRPEADGRAGWCYSREEFPHRPYGSMTAGGVASLSILHRLARQEWRDDPWAVSGFSWLSYHFTVLEHFGPVEELMAREVLSDTPNPRTEFYYWLWAVERAATLCGADALGGRNWYEEGLRELLATQRPDGSWSSGVKRCQPVWDTCYAVLFLTRATRGGKP